MTRSTRRPIRAWLVASIPLALAAPSCSGSTATPPPTGYTVVAEYPHDSAAYTQGLVLDEDGSLLESTGLYGQSSLRRVAFRTGVPSKLVPLPAERFGEGLASLDGRLYQLTWQSGVAYIYDKATLELRDSVTYHGEGWGLTTDGKSLIWSDGSDTLRTIDPRTFAVQRSVGVRFSTGVPVTNLNELEYIGGEIFANVYQSDWILRINPETGTVTEILDLGTLLPDYSAAMTGENVLNGIAWDPSTGHLLVTGKRWPRLFELQLDRPPAAARGG